MMRIRKILPLFIVLCAVLSAQAATWTTIDYPGADSTTLTGINNAGDMVGYYTLANQYYGFLLKNGQFISINVPNTHDTYPLGINDSDRIVGGYNPNSGSSHGFVFDGETFTTLDFPGATYGTWISGINNQGALVGGCDTGTEQIAFKWINGSFITINLPPGALYPEATAINKHGDIAGSFYTEDVREHGYILLGGSEFHQIDYPERRVTYVYGLNDKRIVTGTFNHHSFKLKIGSNAFIKMSFPGAPYTAALAINNASYVVGNYGDSKNVQHGFLRVPSN